MRIFIPLLILILLLNACNGNPNKQIDEGALEDGIYQNDEIGWTMKIPDGWEITQKDSLANKSGKALDYISETGGIDYVKSKQTQLLTFQKNKFNTFQSTSEPFDSNYEGKWEDNNEALKKLLYETFTSKGIKVDTSSSMDKIDQLEFKVFHIIFYGPGDKPMLNQDIYAKHINGYDFRVNLNYPINDKENEMIRVWRNSKFE